MEEIKNNNNGEKTETKHRGKRRRKVVNQNFLLFTLNFPPFKFL